MGKTIIITEEMSNRIKDLLGMTKFKFNSNMKRFLAGLIEDPIGTKLDDIFVYNGLDKDKLIKSLVDNKVIKKHISIDDHDTDGNPHTAIVRVKYIVPKDRLNDRLDALYDILFPDDNVTLSSVVNEDVEEASSCCGVGGSFIPPISLNFHKPKKHKKKRRKKNIIEGVDEYQDSLINTDDVTILPYFNKRMEYCKSKLGNPIGNGSSRTVFRVEHNKVLKLAKNRKGIAQNRAECNNCNDYYMGDMFAKVYEYDRENYTYIISEEARVPTEQDFQNILGVKYSYFVKVCLGAEAEYSRYQSHYELTQDDYDYLEENEELKYWYDYITNYQPTSVYEIIRKRNLGVVHREDGDAIVIIDSGFDDDVKSMYYRKVNKGRKNVTRNDKGEEVPETCTCGGHVGLYICGEPVYKCAECGKYYGTMPFPMKKKMNEAVTGEDDYKSAALYVYNKDKHENWYILCARRSNRKDDEEGGKWNPPMGHLHKGETIKDGALRECLEESGIDLSKYKKDIKIMDHHTWGSNCVLKLGNYVSPSVTIDDFEPKKGDEENIKFIWLPLKDIKTKTWAWTCGENACHFIPDECEDTLEDSTVVSNDKTLNESGLISPEDAIKCGFGVPESDRTWKEGEFVIPKNIGVAYKVFFLGKDGNLYPPMIANENGKPTPVGEWLPASSPVIVGHTEKEHRPQVKSGGKGTKGGSSILAFRPGWHMGEIPYAAQFFKKEKIDGRPVWPSSLVWAECEYSNDIDYQDEAMSYGYSKSGKFMHSRAGLPKIPKFGSYKYRTNPNPDTVPWIISGAMKVRKLLSFDEVEQILRNKGVVPPIVMSEKEYNQIIKSRKND